MLARAGARALLPRIGEPGSKPPPRGDAAATAAAGSRSGVGCANVLDAANDDDDAVAAEAAAAAV